VAIYSDGMTMAGTELLRDDAVLAYALLRAGVFPKSVAYCKPNFGLAVTDFMMVSRVG
jgi:hypothetical protein